MTDQSLTPNVLKADVLRHLTFTLGKDVPNASIYDWRMALPYSLRDRIVGPWFTSTRRTWDENRKRVYYLSMEFLIGRLIEDAMVNLGLYDIAAETMADYGQDIREIIRDEPDAALGNGGLGRLAACFMEALHDAVRRKVRVVILLQGRVEYRLLHYATQALYSKLLTAGIRIFEYRRSFLHAKVAVVDRHWATVGSSNIDPFSLLVA